MAKQTVSQLLEILPAKINKDSGSLKLAKSKSNSFYSYYDFNKVMKSTTPEGALIKMKNHLEKEGILKKEKKKRKRALNNSIIHRRPLSIKQRVKIKLNRQNKELKLK